MIHVKTATGELFEVAWIGVSNIDGALRFALINPDINRAFQVFTNPENCTVITRIFDEDESVFEGFTVFRGIQVSYDNNAVVTLSKI